MLLPVDLRPLDGDEVLEVQAPGFVPARLLGSAVLRGVLESGGHLEDLRIVLARGATLEGSVVDEQGRPIARATVQLTDQPEGRDPPVAGWERFQSDEQGRFRIPDLDPERALYLYAGADGRTPTRVPLLGRLQHGRTIALDIRLPALREVLLTVRLDPWVAGISWGIDGVWTETEGGPQWRDTTGTGPHDLTVCDADGSWMASRPFEVPADAEAYEVVVDLRGQVRVVRGAGGEETYHRGTLSEGEVTLRAEETVQSCTLVLVPDSLVADLEIRVGGVRQSWAWRAAACAYEMRVTPGAPGVTLHSGGVEFARKWIDIPRDAAEFEVRATGLGGEPLASAVDPGGTGGFGRGEIPDFLHVPEDPPPPEYE